MGEIQGHGASSKCQFDRHGQVELRSTSMLYKFYDSITLVKTDLVVMGITGERNGNGPHLPSRSSLILIPKWWG